MFHQTDGLEERGYPTDGGLASGPWAGRGIERHVIGGICIQVKDPLAPIMLGKCQCSIASVKLAISAIRLGGGEQKFIPIIKDLKDISITVEVHNLQLRKEGKSRGGDDKVWTHCYTDVGKDKVGPVGIQNECLIIASYFG